MEIAQTVVIVVLGLALVAWTAYDAWRAPTWPARIRIVLAFVVAVLAGAFVA